MLVVWPYSIKSFFLRSRVLTTPFIKRFYCEKNMSNKNQKTWIFIVFFRKMATKFNYSEKEEFVPRWTHENNIQIPDLWLIKDAFETCENLQASVIDRWGN